VTEDKGPQQEVPGTGGNAGASGVRVGGGDQGATLDGETAGPGGDTSPAVTEGSVDPEAQEIVTDVFTPDGNRQDDGDVTPEPKAENLAVVDDPILSPEVAAAAAAEIEAAEIGDAATAGTHATGGEAAPDPK
jgi:large subunit ribosomal protein L17